MAWAVRASTNTLATPDNLARWGKRVDTTCSMVGFTSTCTLGHLLSSCAQSLDRFNFRHDSVLQHLLDTINKFKKQQVMVYADLAGWRTNGSTVLQDLVLADQIPDLVVVDRSATPGRVILLELTVPWDSSTCFQAALDRKAARYERLAGDIEEQGLTVMNLPLEVGCRGVINARNCGVLAVLCSTIGIRGLKQLKAALGKIALVGSYRIWLARRSQEWSLGELVRA